MDSNETDPSTDRVVYLVASGDERLSANQACWPAQDEMEKLLIAAVEKTGWMVKRAHKYKEKFGHGFLYCQKMGMDVFRKHIPKDAPVIIATSVWQFSHFVLGGLYDHRGPVLTISNFSGQWPGLVGLLNLNASLTKMDKAYSTLWSVDFSDAFFLQKLEEWLSTKRIRHDLSHVHTYSAPIFTEHKDSVALGVKLAAELRHKKAIMGIFDEGCMGMYNALFEDHYLHKLGIWKERMSQAALYAEMQNVSCTDAQAFRDWLDEKGMNFHTGENEDEDLTDSQILEQGRMYIAAIRIADRYGCSLIGIQYQLGMKDLCAASDLAEGLMNNVERPPVYHIDDETRELFPGKPVIHFNEVDEGAGVDALCTNRVWTSMEMDPATTLHDVRYGEEINGSFVWVLEISGSVPPSHLIEGFKGAVSERQPKMYFPRGGGTIKGISKPGEIVWSRVYIQNGKMCADIGRGSVLELSKETVERLWRQTTRQWPMMLATFHGVNRNQLMAQHKANHVQVAYGNDAFSADRALEAKAAMFHNLGIHVNVVGNVGDLH